MSRVAVPRMLATSSLVSAAAALRLGTRGAALLARQAPALARLAASASIGGSAPRAQAEFRDELLGLYRGAAELSWLELRRAIDELDSATRPPKRLPGGRSERRYRVKP